MLREAEVRAIDGGVWAHPEWPPVDPTGEMSGRVVISRLLFRRANQARPEEPILEGVLPSSEGSGYEVVLWCLRGVRHPATDAYSGLCWLWVGERLPLWPPRPFSSSLIRNLRTGLLFWLYLLHVIGIIHCPAWAMANLGLTTIYGARSRLRSRQGVLESRPSIGVAMGSCSVWDYKKFLIYRCDGSN